MIFDNLGGDSVAINLLNGAYYSLSAEGAMTMEQVRDGAELLDRKPLGHFLAEGLVVESDPTSNTQDEPVGATPFEKFTDLESMLAADPVHDVDERGWPRLQ